LSAPAADGAPSGSKDVSHAARSGAVQTLTILAQALLSVTHVLLARLFGAAVFGSYQTCLAVLEILTRSGAAGADKGMLRYVAAHRASGEPHLVQRALGTGLRLSIGVAGALALALIVTSGLVAHIYHQPPLAPALRLVAPAVAFTACVYVLVNASLAAKVTWANFVVRGLGEPMLLMAAGLLAAVFGRTLFHLAVAHLLAAATTFVLAIAVVARVFGRGEIGRAVRSPGLPGFARFSIPLGAAELMNAVMQRADVMLLTLFAGPSVTAVYAAAEFVTRVVGNARSVFDAVAAPVFSEAVHLGQRDRLRDNLMLMSRWVATAAAPLAVTVVALRHDLLALYGPTFQSGAVALTVLAASHLINATFGLNGYVLIVGGRSRILLINNIVVAMANIVTGLILIPRLGMLGAAIAALAGVVLLHVLVTIEVRLAHRVYPIGWSLLKPLAGAAAMLVIELLVAAHVQRVGARVALVILAGLATYLSVLMVAGLPPEDQQLIARGWDRLRARRRRGW
jgi:O-antigen/teichoic acid export membrane protein